MTTKKLLLIDDHPMVLEGLKALFQNREGIMVAAAFTHGKDALAYLKKQPAVDLVFLDIDLPEINGFELCKRIRNDFPAVKILALSTHYERSGVARMIQNGASGYIAKTAGAEELMTAIDTVCNNGMYLGADIQQKLTLPEQPGNRAALPKLTRREKELLLHIADGKTTAQIAGLLFMSPLTAETHRKNLMRKLGANNTATLIKTAVENGLL
ncbi:MAG TPA: response regulator transcription factor [Niabella sp.]